MTSLGPVITYDEPYRWSDEMPSEWRRRLRARSADEMLAGLEDKWESEYLPIRFVWRELFDDYHRLADMGICIDCRVNRADKIRRCDPCNRKMLEQQKRKRAMKQVV